METAPQPAQEALAQTRIRYPNATRQIGPRFRRFRMKAGLSQSDVGRLLECPRTYISKIERSCSVPTLGTCLRLAAILNVGVADLMPLPADSKEKMRERALSDPFLSQMAKYLPQIRESDRIAVENAARLMAAGMFNQFYV